MTSFMQGFGIGAGLIVAIGAQNSFVLYQGIRRQHLIVVPLLCTLCDALLISVGTFGLGSLISAHPQWRYYSGIGGALFLFFYGCRSLYSAWHHHAALQPEPAETTLRAVVLTTLALSLLNPHAYFDTIVMIGAVGGQLEDQGRQLFALGACSASLAWFFLLSFGGSLLEPFFRRPRGWMVLDLCICAIMWVMAYSIWPSSGVL